MTSRETTRETPVHDPTVDMIDPPFLEQDEKALHKWGWWSGRSELGFVAFLVIIATVLMVDSLTMTVLGEQQPGPQFFPILISIVLYVVAVGLLVVIIRQPTYPDGQPHPGRGNYSAQLLMDLGQVGGERARRRYSKISSQWATYTDWKTVGMVVGSLVVFILVLPFAGWILSATFLFWAIAYAMGARAGWVDVAVALMFASVIQLAFNAGLGLPLPAGFLEGLL